MSYLREKLKVEGKLKKLKIIVIVVVIVVLLGLCIFSGFVPARTWKYYVGKPNIEKRAKGEMRLHFLDVGQGDAVIVELPDGKNMMIDGGNNTATAEKNIMRYLNALKINRIDYLILTHADSDHCGALNVVLEEKEVKNAFIPNADVAINQEYAEFYAMLQKENCEIAFSSRGLILNGNGEYSYTLSFLYPYTLDIEENEGNEESVGENNASSAVVWLDYLGASALFTGDAPMEVEEKLIRDDKLGLFAARGVELSSTEIVKVAHHGSKYSTSLEFLQYIQTKTAVISCGEGNFYGHPTEEVLERLQAVNAEIFRTDENGHVMITVTKDGNYTTKLVS